MAEAARSELDEAILDVQRRLDQAHDPAKLEALLRDSVEQHRLLLNELTAELELEKRDCEDHKESLRELQQISHALTKPLEPLASNAAPSELLRMMLRFLLEHLLNALWDTPSHPYVSTRGYDPAVLAFVQRAGLIEAHPSEASVVRLVAFHEPLPDPSMIRPTLYK